MKKVKQILFKQPLLSLAALCFAIAIASPFVVVESQSLEKPAVVQQVSPTVTVAPSESEERDQAVQGEATYNQIANPVVSTQTPTSAPQQTAQATATPTNQPTSAPAVQTFQVNLKINGASVGTVDMQEGNNQCDVLSHAKDQGKISSLLMKYDNSLGTNGVYQINGIGKENTVWWVYKVNGASPTQGCSYIKANSSDTVEWEYKG